MDATSGSTNWSPIQGQSLGICEYWGPEGTTDYENEYGFLIKSGVFDYWPDLVSDRWAYRVTPTTGYSDINVSFQWKAGMRGYNIDYCQFGYSLNGGANNTWVWLTSGGKYNGQYYSQTTVANANILLPAECNNQSNIAIGFRFYCSGTGGNQNDIYGPSFIVDNFSVSGTVLQTCTSPSIVAEANNMSGQYSVCPRAGIVNLNLSANPTGGSGCSGNFEFSWYNGSKYWDGTGFNSSSPVLNESFSSISLPVSDTANYTANVQCSDLPTCASSSSVAVTVLKDVSNITAEIGNPTNGTSNHMTVNWGKVDGASYTLQFSKDNVTWITTGFNGSSTSYDHNPGEYPNSPCFYQIQTYTGTTSCGDWVPMLDTAFTACDFPVLTAQNPTGNSINLSLQNDNNPDYTLYSIECKTTGKFVQVNGTLDADSVFQTKAQWGTINVIGLNQGTNYCFYAIAKNKKGNVQTQGIASLQCISTLNCNSPSVISQYPVNGSTLTRCEMETL